MLPVIRIEIRSRRVEEVHQDFEKRRRKNKMILSILDFAVPCPDG